MSYGRHRKKRGSSELKEFVRFSIFVFEIALSELALLCACTMMHKQDPHISFALISMRVLTKQLFSTVRCILECLWDRVGASIANEIKIVGNFSVVN